MGDDLKTKIKAWSHILDKLSTYFSYNITIYYELIIVVIDTNVAFKQTGLGQLFFKFVSI